MTDSADATASALEELLPLKRVMDMTGCSRTRIYGLIKEGSFPLPLKMWGRSLWVLSEIQAWIQEQIRERSRLETNVGMKVGRSRPSS